MPSNGSAPEVQAASALSEDELTQVRAYRERDDVEASNVRAIGLPPDGLPPEQLGGISDADIRGMISPQAHTYANGRPPATVTLSVTDKDEAVGSGTFTVTTLGSTVDPETGRTRDDIKPIIERFDWLSEEDKHAIFEGNARKVFGLES